MRPTWLFLTDSCRFTITGFFALAALFCLDVNLLESKLRSEAHNAVMFYPFLASLKLLAFDMSVSAGQLAPAAGRAMARGIEQTAAHRSAGSDPRDGEDGDDTIKPPVAMADSQGAEAARLNGLGASPFSTPCCSLARCATSSTTAYAEQGHEHQP